jgi:hypothetical protein
MHNTEHACTDDIVIAEVGEYIDRVDVACCCLLLLLLLLLPRSTSSSYLQMCYTYQTNRITPMITLLQLLDSRSTLLVYTTFSCFEYVFELELLLQLRVHELRIPFNGHFSQQR